MGFDVAHTLVASVRLCAGAHVGHVPGCWRGFAMFLRSTYGPTSSSPPVAGFCFKAQCQTRDLQYELRAVRCCSARRLVFARAPQVDACASSRLRVCLVAKGPCAFRVCMRVCRFAIERARQSSWLSVCSDVCGRSLLSSLQLQLRLVWFRRARDGSMRFTFGCMRNNSDLG